MAVHQHHASASERRMEVVGSSTKGSKRASTKRVRKDRWERRIEEAWQGNLETLRQCICEMLSNKQHLRREQM